MADNTNSQPFARDVHGLVNRGGLTSPVIHRAGAALRPPAALEAQQVIQRGLYTSGQMARWRKVTGAVHAKGGRMYVQLWYVGCHARGHDGEGAVDDFRIAAAQAITAGFDGVELHVTNGFLLEQFLKGGAVQLAQGNHFSIEQRARLLLDIVAAVVTEIGADRTRVLIAPPSATDGAAADREAAARYSFIVGRLGVAYHREVDGAVNRPCDVTPFDCSLLSAVLQPPELRDGRGTPSEANRSGAAHVRVEPPAARAMAAIGKDRRDPLQVRQRQVAAEFPFSRAEIRAAVDVNTLPEAMDVDELVDAALVGFDRRELVTISPLHVPERWDALDGARQGLLPDIRQAHAADRYRHTA